MIAECRNIARSYYGLKNGKWIKDYSNSGKIPDFFNKKIGIICLGSIGLQALKRLLNFKVEILEYDSFINKVELPIKIVSLKELMMDSDFVTIHCPLKDEIKKMINRVLLIMMKPTSYLINTSRAEIVDEDALYQILKGKKIAGATIDVFNVEPSGKDYPLIALENVTVTPHLAGCTKDAFLNSPKLLFKEINKLLGGEIIKNIVNKEILDKNSINSLKVSL